MKTFIKLSALACVLIVQQSYGCDVCGCSLGGSYFGVLPLYNKNFVGLRWSQAKFYAYMDHHSESLPPEYSNDTYRKAELWGRVYLNKRLQLFGFVPYLYNSMNGSEQVISSSGLGDVTLVTNYLLINTGEAKDKRFKHSLQVGAGIKLPSGKFRKEDRGKLINPNFQMGTGSVDFLISSIYTIRYQKVGLSLESGYKINTRNSHAYRFGNQFHTSGQFFYWQKAGAFSLLPSGGLYYEQAARHNDAWIIQANTGGEALLAVGGFDVYYKNFTAGVNYKHTMDQQYNSDEIADIKGRDRWTLSLMFNF